MPIPMKIATWNVNSIRTRLDQVLNWLKENPIAVLCLQETKVIDDDFPQQPFLDLGYHLEISGQKAYNGVAIVSQSPLEQVSRGFAPILGESAVGDLDDQKRVITGVIQNVQVVNLYVPNGASVGSDKYDYKLRWLATLRDYLAALMSNAASLDRSDPKVGLDSKSTIPLCVCGDFNIALEDIDIHDPTDREKHIMASDAEREALNTVLKLGLRDAFRKFTAEGGHYSWWDYRTGAFRRNRGWRIDHLYLSDPLYDRALACTIDTAPRKLDQPSDHAPVVLELAPP